jgi:CheY-like chemotaxis protein
MEHPFATYASHHDPRPAPQAFGAPRPVSHVPRARILVVDDDPLIAEVVSTMLASEGYQVRCAQDGDAALDPIVAASPDFVVSDIMMPKLDGVALARRLRDWGLAVPVVLISAVYQDVDLPGVRFVPKPFDLEHLLEVVARALGERP